jgi:hypothetical protein
MIPIAILMSACQGGSKINTVDGWCATNRPIFYTRAEAAAATRTTKEKVVAHNEYGERNCGWKPTR